MKRLSTRLALAFCLAGPCGCVPQKLVVWAPDGKKAAVIGGEGLYLADGDGELSGRLVPGAAAAAWLPDSERLVVEVVRSPATWQDVEPYLSPAEKERITGVAGRFVREATASGEPLARVADRIRAAEASHAPNFDDDMTTLLFLREHHGARLSGRFGKEWEPFRDGALTMSTVQVFDVSGGRARPGPVLGFTFSHVDDIRPSPDGSSVAYVTDDVGSPGTCRIFLAPADGKRPAVMAADLAARYPDWSPDGRSLVYARASAPRGGSRDTLRLGSLTRLRVAGSADRPRGSGEAGDAPEVLAGFVFSEWTKVRCLKDGRILFSGAEVSLPATEEDMPTRLSLFAVEPGRRPTVARLVPRRAEAELAEAVHQFELSPDQTRVAVPGVGGRLTVLALDSGAVTEVRARSGDSALRMVPTWRNDRDLCSAAPNEGALEKRRPGEFYLWSAGQIRTLSGAWPDSVVAALRARDAGPPRDGWR